MNMIELRKKLFAALVAAMAVGMLSACSSTEETSSNGGGLDACKANCAAGDAQCVEKCYQDLNI